MSDRTQNDAILAWMESGKAITPLEALTLFGCFRLSARILELRGEGKCIESRRITTPSGKSVASYSLAK